MYFLNIDPLENIFFLCTGFDLQLLQGVYFWASFFVLTVNVQVRRCQQQTETEGIISASEINLRVRIFTCLVTKQVCF